MTRDGEEDLGAWTQVKEGEGTKRCEGSAAGSELCVCACTHMCMWLCVRIREGWRVSGHTHG